MNPAGATGEVRLRRIESTVRIAPKPLSWLKRVVRLIESMCARLTVRRARGSLTLSWRMSLDANAVGLVLGGESGFHEADEFVGVRYGGGVAWAAANDRAGDGVKFGLATSGDVFLH
jgi:hypothetical protein